MGICQNKSIYIENMNTTDIQFTRYLYEKDEVKLSLIVSMLNKKEETIFWGYELYHSGFISELVELLFTIYYDFYATLNPSFGKYLHIKLKDLLHTKTEKVDDDLLSIILNNFMIRPHTCDVFFMRQFAKEMTFMIPFIKDYQETNDFTIMENELIQLLEMEDYLTIARLIFYDISNNNLKDVLELFIDYFILKGVGLKKKEIIKDYKNKINNEFLLEKIVLFSCLIHFSCLSKKIKMGKNMYVHIEPEEVIMYENIEVNLNEKGDGYKNPVLPAYKILPTATLYSIDEDEYLSLFHLKREKMNIVEVYRNNWLFYASFSPIWKKRIEAYHGTIDYENKVVEFYNDNIDEFYKKYGLEPDEQKIEVQNKTIGQIVKKRNWYDFYLQHNNRGVIEIDKSYFDNIEKLTY